MVVKTTRTTDPQTGNLTAITVEWDEGIHPRCMGNLLTFLLITIPPTFVAISEPLPPNGSTAGNGIIFVFGLIFILPIVFTIKLILQKGFLAEKPIRTLIIRSNGILECNGNGYLYEGGGSISDTTLADIKEIMIDDANNWLRKSEIENNPESRPISWMVIILQRTDGQSVFLSKCNHPRGVLQPVLVALTNAIEEIKKHVKTNQKMQNTMTDFGTEPVYNEK